MKRIQKLAVNSTFQVIFITVLCSLIFLLNTARFNSWLVDDAGISFAYSRSLANGFGLVAQQGALPVEGYSNPAWVFLFALVDLLGVELLSSVKIIAAVISIGTIFLAVLISCRITHKALLTLLGVGWIVLQPGLVIWFVSGLENPLYAFLILLLVWLSIREQNHLSAVLAGLTAALVGLTRPEGCVFLLIYLIANRKQWKPFVISFVLLYGAYFAFRWLYFGYPLPNTFYMKVGGGFQVKEIFGQVYYNLRVLGNGILGKTGFWIGLVLIPVLFVITTWKKKFEKPITILLIAAGLALVTFLLLPSDWMGELRFASPALVLFPILLTALLHQLSMRVNPALASRVSLASLVLFAAWLGTNLVTDYLPRLEKFASAPTVDLRSVQASAQLYDQFAEILGISDYSILQADVGGALWLDQYRVIDLGGLVDATIARTLGRNTSALCDYIFEEVKPDMIELHGKWAMRANLQGDPRLEGQYEAILSSVDTTRVTEDGQPVLNGFFIRKELITSAEQFDQLKQLAGQ